MICFTLESSLKDKSSLRRFSAAWEKPSGLNILLSPELELLYLNVITREFTRYFGNKSRSHMHGCSGPSVVQDEFGLPCNPFTATRLNRY
jgi:hypothetical protein